MRKVLFQQIAIVAVAVLSTSIACLEQAPQHPRIVQSAAVGRSGSAARISGGRCDGGSDI